MKTQKIKTVWEVREYFDVWKDEEGGYIVNGGAANMGEVEIMLAVKVANQGTPREFKYCEIPDSEIRKIFNLPRKKICGDGDDTRYYVELRDGYPIGFLTCTSHESLSPIMRYRVKCQYCKPTMINGTLVHESRECPNNNAKFDTETGEWIKTLTCDVCGYDYPDGESCCNGEDEES